MRLKVPGGLMHVTRLVADAGDGSAETVGWRVGQIHSTALHTAWQDDP
jgi:hypothetical protein